MNPVTTFSRPQFVISAMPSGLTVSVRAEPANEVAAVAAAPRPAPAVAQG